MTSEYMRKLIETIESEPKEQDINEGVLDAIEDYFVDKGLEWQGKYSQKALGKLDNRKLAQTVYDVYKYNVGKTNQEQSMQNLIKFFQKLMPDLHRNTIASVMKKAGVKFDQSETTQKNKQTKKSATQESFTFIRSLNEQNNISDRQVKKAIRAFVSYLTQQETDEEAWLNNLIKYASDKQRREIEQNLGQAAEDAAEDVDSDDEQQKPRVPGKVKPEKDTGSQKERDKADKKEMPNKPVLVDFAEKFGVSEEALRGLRVAGQLGYFSIDKKDRLKFEASDFVKDWQNMSNAKSDKKKDVLGGYKLNEITKKRLEEFIEETRLNQDNVAKMATTILNYYPNWLG